MDIKTYVKQFQKDGGKIADLASRAGMSTMYLRHIISGYKEKPGLEKVVGIMVATDGQVTLKSLRPDLYPRGVKGKKFSDSLAHGVRAEI